MIGEQFHFMAEFDSVKKSLWKCGIPFSRAAKPNRIKFHFTPPLTTREDFQATKSPRKSSLSRPRTHSGGKIKAGWRQNHSNQNENVGSKSQNSK
nr:hypothetical protein Iba_chr09eCG2470 [Ipomoea batatas]